MSDLFLLIAGVFIFAMTTVATLWFGYGTFYRWYEHDADEAEATTLGGS